MDKQIIFEPAIGDAIIKKETITCDQMKDQIKHENLMYNAEMNEEMRRKWFKELRKYCNNPYW